MALRTILGSLLGMALMAGCATLEAGEGQGGIQVIAHRGASAYAPENTLEAFRQAHEMKAEWFELDCTLTADGHAVVIHDGTLDRTTNGSGAVAEYTLAEIKALDAGSWKDARFAGEPVPTLDEALDLARDLGIGVYLEIKDSDNDAELRAAIRKLAQDVPTLTPELWRRTMELIEADGTRNLELTRRSIRAIRERGLQRQVVIQSFSPIVCAIAIHEAPDVRVEYLGAANPERPEVWEDYLRWGYLLDVAGFNIHKDSLNLGRLAAFHKAGKTVAVWTVNDEAEMRRFMLWGVDFLITDRPDAAVRVREEVQKPVVTPLARTPIAGPAPVPEPGL